MRNPSPLGNGKVGKREGNESNRHIAARALASFKCNEGLNMHSPLEMITPDQLERRSVLKGVTLGAGAVVLQPFLNALAAEARSEAPPQRIIFKIQGNGLWPHHNQPNGADRKRAGRLAARRSGIAGAARAAGTLQESAGDPPEAVAQDLRRRRHGKQYGP